MATNIISTSAIPPVPNKVTVELATPETIWEYAKIRNAAFLHTINKILYTKTDGMPSQETLQKVGEGFAKDLSSPEFFFLLARDAETGEVLAGAKWGFHHGGEDGNGGWKERSGEKMEEELSIPEMWPESEPRVWNTMFGLLAREKRENLGRRPYFDLYTLVAYPHAQRRGAGSALLRWGCEQADAKGVEAYLEASPMGAPLYERFGFEKIKLIGHPSDLPELATNAGFPLTIMIRQPRRNGEGKN